MSHERSHYSSRENSFGYSSRRHYRDHSRRGREWSEARRRRGSRERWHTSARHQNQQQSNDIQHRTSERPHIGNNPVHYQENFHPQRVFNSLGNSSRDLSQRYFPSSTQESSYPRHQMNGLCTTSARNTSTTRNTRYTLNTRNTSAFSYGGRHCVSSATSLDMSQRMDPENPTTGMSMAKLPFVEVIASLLKVQIYPAGESMYLHTLCFIITGYKPVD